MTETLFALPFLVSYQTENREGVEPVDQSSPILGMPLEDSIRVFQALGEQGASLVQRFLSVKVLRPS